MCTPSFPILGYTMIVKKKYKHNPLYLVKVLHSNLGHINIL